MPSWATDWRKTERLRWADQAWAVKTSALRAHPSVIPSDEAVPPNPPASSPTYKEPNILIHEACGRGSGSLVQTTPEGKERDQITLCENNF